MTGWYVTQYRDYGDEGLVNEYPIVGAHVLESLRSIFGYDPRDPEMIIVKPVRSIHRRKVERLIGRTLDAGPYSYFVEYYATTSTDR
jgi:hypothetical protein